MIILDYPVGPNVVTGAIKSRGGSQRLEAWEGLYLPIASSKMKKATRKA